MPYNPRVQHRYGDYMGRGIAQAGEYEAQGITGAANATASGIRARAEGIASGISSAGSSIAGGIQKAGSIWAEENAKMNQATGEIEGMRAAGVITPEEMDAYAKVRNPDKLHGMLAIKREQIQNDLIMKRQEQNQITNYAIDRLSKEAQAQTSRKGQLYRFQDPITGQEQTWIDTGPQLTRFEPPGKSGDEDKPPNIQRKQMGNEYYYWDAANNKMVPPSNIKQDTGIAISPDPDIVNLEKKRAKLQGQIAAGDLRPGVESGFLKSISEFIGVPSHEKQLAGVEAELKGLGGGSGAGPTPGAQVSSQGQISTPGAGAGTYKTKDDVKAALSRGELTPEQAIKILRAQFGM